MISSRPPAAPAPTIYLAAIDDTASAPQVVAMATGIARNLGGPAEVHLLHVTQTPPTEGLPAFYNTSDLLEKGRGLLDRACAEAKFEGRIVGHLALGEPWREIVGMGSRLGADVIIVGTTEKKSVARFLLGSVAEKVVRHAGCPVLVARPKTHEASVPEIEPPCPSCVETQRASKGETLWCANHAARHPHGRLHYEMPRGYGAGSMFIRPE